MRSDPFLEGLTDRQREAVAHGDGPLLVLAGAGSGKTRVITRRAARLAAEAGPQRVLAITFTNKAAEEMRERIAGLGRAQGMWICTFHSLCARLLRLYGERIGLSREFTIFDQTDRLAAVRTALEESGLASSNWRPRSIEAVISRAKNEMLSA
jgi:DNA helicase-2/ATP-dependent DNA helicase PcrA